MEKLLSEENCQVGTSSNNSNQYDCNSIGQLTDILLTGMFNKTGSVSNSTSNQTSNQTSNLNSVQRFAEPA